jgi:NitT/TauT family transport system permease protein
MFGLLGGVVFGSSTLVYDGFYPALVGFNSIPKVAVIPILVIWFGIGTVPAIVTAFLISFFPILVNVAAGIATVEPNSRTCCGRWARNSGKSFRKSGCRDRCLISLPR